MQLTNTEDDYGLIHKTLHWVIAVLIIGLIPVGLGMGMMENSPLKFQVYAMHKSFGILVLALGVIRLLWRFFSPVPDDLETHKPWERALAGAAHFWLYVCIIGMPLTGWLMSSGLDFPVPFFGLQLPPLMGKDENLGHLFGNAHEILAYTLLFVLALHAAGALKHHVLDKDETLRRMTWRKAGIGLAVVIVLMAGASYALSGLSIMRGFLSNTEKVAADQNAASATQTLQPVAALPDTSNLPEHGWAIVPGKTKLSFKAMLYGGEFEGVFKDVTGAIVFNPADLASAKLDIRIGMQNVATGDAERDTNIKSTDWFDSGNYPESRFESITFEQTGEGKYIVVGNLTIRGATLPVTIPFDLTIQDNIALVKGDVTLDRVGFGVGATDQWQADDTVGRSVQVLIDLTAIQ